MAKKKEAGVPEKKPKAEVAAATLVHEGRECTLEEELIKCGPDEAKELSLSGKLTGYNPKTGIARVKK
jgi:hypothetical protein